MKLTEWFVDYLTAADACIPTVSIFFPMWDMKVLNILPYINANAEVIELKSYQFEYLIYISTLWCYCRLDKYNKLVLKGWPQPCK